MSLLSYVYTILKSNRPEMTGKARLLKLFILLHLFVTLLLGVWLHSQSSQDYTEWVGSKAASTVHVGESSQRDASVSATSKLDHVASMDIGRAQDSTTTSDKTLIPHRGDQLGREKLSNNSRVTQVAKTVLPSQLPSKPSRSSHTVTQSSADLQNQKGYALSLSFWDQMTFSTGNLLSLQCWAGLYNMRVPEPFLIDSYFRAPLRTRDFEDKNPVKLSDVYDLEYWNACSQRQSYATLTKWEEFISNAPRDVLLVYLKPLYVRPCPLESMKENILETLHAYEFRIVKEVCYNKIVAASSLENFTHTILGNYSASKVTVIFQEWALVSFGFAVPSKGNPCAIHVQDNFPCIEPSWKVSEDVQTYLDAYLNSRKYVAAMARFEWMIILHYTDLEKNIQSCLNKTIMLVELAKRQAHTNSTFVTNDVGKYGSKSDELLTSEFVQHQAHLLYKAIYGSSSSLENWENTFEKVSRTRNSGYIAFMQKVIASRAECLILVGGGTFHRHTLEMYRKHREQTSRKMCCVLIDSNCNVKLTLSEGLHLP